MNLKLTRLMGLASIGSLLLLLPIQVFGVGDDGTEKETQPTVQTTAAEGMAEDLIRHRARLISVRVFAVHRQEWENNGLILDASGSGILIGRKFIKKDPTALYQYLVLTNHHVAKKSNQNDVESACRSYVKTPDGLIHKACYHPKANFDETDLSLLYFQSPYKYEKAEISSQGLGSLKPGDKVFVAGFPCDLASTRTIKCSADYKFISGEVRTISEKPLVDGYQIGYTNEVIEGTSGGPILNNKGEVVGINGRREGGNDSTYTYKDGSKAEPSEIEQMRQLRWGIPIDEYLKQDKNKPDKEKLLATAPLHPERFQQIRYFRRPEEISDLNSDKPDEKEPSDSTDVELSTDAKSKDIRNWLNPQRNIGLIMDVVLILIQIQILIKLAFVNRPIRKKGGEPSKAGKKKGF